MLTWIIIALAIGVIFGIIDFKNLHLKTKSLYNQLIPIAKKTIADTKNKAQAKIDSINSKNKE